MHLDVVEPEHRATVCFARMPRVHLGETEGEGEREGGKRRTEGGREGEREGAAHLKAQVRCAVPTHRVARARIVVEPAAERVALVEPAAADALVVDAVVVQRVVELAAKVRVHLRERRLADLGVHQRDCLCTVSLCSGSGFGKCFVGEL